ncbi:putative Peroxidase 48 [Mercurialis annua]|uniref:putative Peroxidase 48 n=1 Tax=Mercurialis annua TaxID=3986 RepID=UPI00216062DF|nr:putative Peroxidase 48 [Mercurialis annua]
MENMFKMTVFVLIMCILISFKNQTYNKNHTRDLIFEEFDQTWDTYPSFFLSTEQDEAHSPIRSLEYDFYRSTCPQAEKIIQNVVRELYKVKFSVSPALLRLVFHDCFVAGCDASILLDGVDDKKSEKDSTPNHNLKGFDIIDLIKSQVEEICPGIVSCADIVVLAAREGVLQAGGPFYPLFTGRRDSTQSFSNMAENELPSPHADLSDTLASFASRGFDERETVSLLGGHSLGVVHCRFFEDRLYNFSGTNKPDPSVDSLFLNFLRSKCNRSDASESPTASSPYDSSVSSSYSSSTKTPTSKPLSPMASSAAPSLSFRGSLSSPPPLCPIPSVLYESSLLSAREDTAINLAYEGPGIDFGTLYYRSLLYNRGILFSDQQLMAAEETGIWVRAYASDVYLFRKDFAQTMMKLSNLHVLTGSAGQVRRNCSKLV